MSDGKIEIDIKLNDSKAASQASKAGKDIAKGVENGLKNVSKTADKAADSIKKPFENAANSAKSSMQGVGDAAKNSFSDVADAAKNSASDAASAFETVPADAAGSFADVSSEAQDGFGDVADAASNAAGDASSAFEDIPADASGAFSDVASAAESGFDGIPDAAQTASGQAADAFGEITEAAESAGDATQEALSFKTLVGAGVATEAITEIVGKLVDLGKKAIETGAQFDKSMSQVAATMGVTTDQVQDLRQYAQKMGETTAFSASQAADALNYMALAGYDADTSMRVLPTVLNLAAAGSMDLAAASDMVTDAQSALGLSVEEAEVMVDQMAKTSSKTNTSVEQLGNAFLTVGGTAKNLQGGTKELAQMLGILADNGIKGSEGGTALRNVILSLSAPTDKAAESIEELGLQVFDAEGNMRSLPDIIQDLNSSMEPLTQQEKTNLLNNIFNKVDLKSVNALLGTSSDRFDEVASAIDNAQGSAQKMAETQLDNLAGDVTLLESATEGFFIAVSDELNPALRSLTKFATNDVMPALTDMVKNFDKIAPTVAAAATAIAILKASSKIMRSLSDETSVLGRMVGKTGAEFKAMNTSAKVAAIGTNTLKASMQALKSVGIMVAITAAIEGIMWLASSFQEAAEKTRKYNESTKGLVDAASGITSAVGDEADAFGDLSGAVSGINLDEITQQHIDLAKSISEVSQEANTSVSMLDQYNDVIQELAGRSDLTEEEVAKLRVAVDGINDSCGTSYEVIQNNAGAYTVMAEGAEIAKDAINDVVEAQKLQIMAEAEMENYKSLYSQLAKDQEAVAKQTAIVSEKQENVNKALEAAKYETASDGAEHVKKAREELENEEEVLKTLNDQLGSTQSATNKVTEKQTLLSMAGDKAASALTKAAASNERYKAGVQSMDVDLVAFTKALEDAGFTAEQVSSLTVEQSQKMAKGWSQGTDQLIAATEEAGVEVPDTLRKMGEESVEISTKSGQDSGNSFASNLAKGTPKAREASRGITNATDSELKKSIGKAKTTATTAVTGFANAIAAGKEKSKSAGKANSDAATKGMGSGDAATPGVNLVKKFAAAMTNNKSKSQAGGTGNANAARDGFRSQEGNASTWGSHLGQNFASGVRSAYNAARDAATAVANAVASVLKHSVPKEGILREGGKGEAVWGQHLVQNLADGMTSNAAQRAIKNATKDIAVDINDNLMHYMKDINPLVQLEESLAKGSAAFSMSSVLSGAAPAYTNNNQTINFNQAVKSPDEIARAMRIQQRYGLAGQR